MLTKWQRESHLLLKINEFTWNILGMDTTIKMYSNYARLFTCSPPMRCCCFVGSAQRIIAVVVLVAVPCLGRIFPQFVGGRGRESGKAREGEKERWILRAQTARRERSQNNNRFHGSSLHNWTKKRPKPREFAQWIGLDEPRRLGRRAGRPHPTANLYN